jgi:dihydrofolate synthase/folylpolyglutamate synthase
MKTAVPDRFPLPTEVADLLHGSYGTRVGHDSKSRDLSSTGELLTKLSIPFDRWTRVVVVGSVGKGSTSIMLARLLEASGKKVGLITSPHIARYNERIRINGTYVSDEDLSKAAIRVKSQVGELSVGYWGLTLVLALQIFKEKGIDVFVCEAGRGGEFDEARLINPTLTVITKITTEHIDVLGPTITDIARTKTRITPPGVSIISTAQTDEVAAVIKKTAKELRSSVYFSNDHTMVTDIKNSDEGLLFNVQIEGQHYDNILLTLNGSFQVENAVTAGLAYHILNPQEPIPFSSLSDVQWPGRLQKISDIPRIYLHWIPRPEYVSQLNQFILDSHIDKPVFIVGLPAEKNRKEILQALAGVKSEIILTEIDGNFAWTSNEIGNNRHVQDYIRLLREIKSDKKKTYFILGNFTFLSEVMYQWRIDNIKLW